jgi:hypothetical protein
MNIPFTKQKSCPRVGSASRSLVSTWIDRLSDLRYSWNRSIVRIVVEEFRNFPLRIVTILRRPSLASVGVPLPDDLLGRDLSGSCLLHSFWPACIQGIQGQRKRHPWIGSLEEEILGEAFRLGATWGWNTADSYNEQSNSDPSQFISSQAISSTSSQTLCATPADIAGVTRRDE